MGEYGESRSGRIAAELRQRIETGRLAPGARVPSTREITREWGVAMATATKVLTELRQQGLVRAVPGVGTVVAAAGTPAEPPAATAPRPAARTGPGLRKPAAEQALTPDRIVATAIEVADSEGLASVSMRRVGTELGVATMSLYRHVADKDDLLIRMMDTAWAELALPADAPPLWRPRLELASRELWAGFRRHPWLAPALSITRPQPLPGAVPYSEWVLATLERHGLDPSTAFTAHLMLLNYIRGTAINLESEAEAEALSGLDSEEWLERQEPAFLALFGTGRFPALERLTAAGYEFDLDHLFEFGLRRILDGIAVLVDAGPR
ncbi:TetR/AcrR family transcriptional regulator C-terminal domain-containing protein [Kitasatospora sp. NPDC049258]|uniref:TetR/AcrR family transcriptional regulator C-terminal domain-containing protein n=1 Tax=Kitasatospora sp. NPDC049258 TaxID=3155394 RepID=UPI003440C956